MKNFLAHFQPIAHSGATAAGTSDTLTPTNPVDMEGADSCTFIVHFGTISASATANIHVGQCDTSGGTYADLTGTEVAVTAADDDSIAVVEVCRPRERYLKCYITRATANSVVNGIIAIRGRLRQKAPADHSTHVAASSEIHVDVAEGTK